jgi:hypothetical protein
VNWSLSCFKQELLYTLINSCPVVSSFIYNIASSEVHRGCGYVYVLITTKPVCRTPSEFTLKQ